MFCEERSRLVLQFHITGRCNLRCKHCYRAEGDVEKLSFSDIINVIEQFISLRQKYNDLHGIKKRGHINLTGGEPFFRKDIEEIIRYLGERRSLVTYSVLSNGSFITDETIKLLKETEVSFVQLSIDGNKNTHDFLRTSGDFKRVFEIAEKLEKSEIRTHISFTANKENYKQLPSVANECRKRHITRLWSDRLVPIGNGEALEGLIITDTDLPKYIRSLKKAQGSPVSRMLYPKTQVTMSRALQFIGSEGSIYSCGAADRLITVDEFGQIMPCRRMPVVCGDIFTSSLEDVYFNHPVFTDLREPSIPPECIACDYSHLCKGGAKCQSYATFGTFKSADPACFLKRKKQ